MLRSAGGKYDLDLFCRLAKTMLEADETWTIPKRTLKTLATRKLDKVKFLLIEDPSIIDGFINYLHSEED